MPIDVSLLPDQPEPDIATGIIDVSLLPDKGEEIVSFRAGKPLSIKERFKDLFRIDFEDQRAKAANAMAYSEAFGISPSEAYRNHDAISKQLGGQDMPTTPELVGGLFILPITAGLIMHPVSTILGLATFEALGEAESLAISLGKNEKYKVFQKRGLADLLPEDINDLTETIVETFDFMWKLKAGKSVFDRAPQLRERFTKQIIEEHKLPEKLFIDPRDLKTELQRGGVLPAEELAIYKELGLSGKEARAAIKYGVHIDIPAEKIITVKDRPWFATVKKILKIDPAQETRVLREGKPEFRLGEKIEPEVKPKEKIEIVPPEQLIAEKIKRLTPEQRQVEIDRIMAEAPAEKRQAEIERIMGDEVVITRRIREKKPPTSPKEIREQLALEKKVVKTRVRIITGQTKIGKLIAEEDALKAAFKKSEQAARIAEREGRKEGVAQEKTRQAVLKERAKARKEQLVKVRTMINQLKDIKKKTEKITPTQAEAIDNLLENLDLTRITPKTTLKLSRTREFLEDNPEAEMPDYVFERLRRLDQRNVKDVTIDELESIHAAVMHHIHLENTKQTIFVRRKRRRVKQVLHDAVGEMKPPKMVEEKIILSQKGRFKRLKKTGTLIKNTMGIRHDHFDLIIESLAGPNSTMDKILFQAMKEGVTKQLSYRQNAYKKFQNDIKDVDVKDIAKWANEEVTIGKFTLTRGHRMALYRHSLNADNRQAILKGGFGDRISDTPNQVFKITEDELLEILDSLTLQELSIAGDSVTDLFERQYDSLNKVFYEKNHYDLPRVDNYYPKEVMPLSRGKDIEFEEALERFKGKFVRVGVPKGMLEARLGSIKPLYLNSLFYDLNKSIMKSAAYIGLELPLTNASKLLYDKTFRRELSDRYGEITWKEIEKGLRDIAGDYLSYTTTEEILLRWKNNLSTAILGINPFVMSKQVLSLPLYLPYVKGEYLWRGIIDTINDPKGISARHKVYSPEYLERVEGGFSRDVADVFKAGVEKRLFAGKKTVRESVMSGIKLFDKGAVIPGMQGAVLQVLAELEVGKLSREVKQALDITNEDIAKLTPEDKMGLAYKFADYATERTQPMFSPEHRSSLSRGSPIERLATMFAAFTNQALNLMRRTWREAQRTKDPEVYNKWIKSMFILLVINPLGVAAIDEIRDRVYKRKKKPALVSRILNSYANYFFFIRDLASSVISGIERGKFLGYDVELPISRYAELVRDVLVDGVTLLIETNPRKRKKAADSFVNNSITLMLLQMGIPYETPKKIVKAVIE